MRDRTSFFQRIQVVQKRMRSPAQKSREAFRISGPEKFFRSQKKGTGIGTGFPKRHRFAVLCCVFFLKFALPVGAAPVFKSVPPVSEPFVSKSVLCCRRAVCFEVSRARQRAVCFEVSAARQRADCFEVSAARRCAARCTVYTAVCRAALFADRPPPKLKFCIFKGNTGSCL